MRVSAWKYMIHEIKNKLYHYQKQIADGLTHAANTTAVTKKAQQRLQTLCKLRKTGLPTTHLITFYRGTIEYVLKPSFTAWFGCCSTKDVKQISRIVKTTSKILALSSIVSAELLPSSRSYTTPLIISSAYCHLGEDTGKTRMKLNSFSPHRLSDLLIN